MARNVSPGTERLFPKLGVHRLCHQLTGGSRPLTHSPCPKWAECGCRQLSRNGLTWVIRVDSILLGSLPVSIRKLTCRSTSPRDQWIASLARAASAWKPKGRTSRSPVKARLPALPVAPRARALTGSRWSGSGLPGAQGWECPNTVNQLLVVIEPINDCIAV